MRTKPTAPLTTVHVCPLGRLDQSVLSAAATHLVTVLDRDSMPPTPPAIAPDRHLRLDCNDIVAPRAGYVHPEPAHITQLVGFARDWNHAGPLLVHCFAGISRSTAAAYVVLCALNEDGLERHIAGALRHASPSATPNALMVALADDLLGRRGRMVDAIAAIGRGAAAFEGEPFFLPSRFSND